MPAPDTTHARAERLARLRAAMARHQVDAFIVPSADPHLSEYLPGRWKGREWLSGFTGSVGTFIATRDFAGVWTDGRYYTQAEEELAGTEIQLMKIPSGASLLHIDWLADNLDEGQTVAVDARVLGLAVARLLGDALAEVENAGNQGGDQGYQDHVDGRGTRHQLIAGFQQFPLPGPQHTTPFRIPGPRVERPK